MSWLDKSDGAWDARMGNSRDSSRNKDYGDGYDSYPNSHISAIGSIDIPSSGTTSSQSAKADNHVERGSGSFTTSHEPLYFFHLLVWPFPTFFATVYVRPDTFSLTMLCWAGLSLVGATCTYMLRSKRFKRSDFTVLLFFIMGWVIATQYLYMQLYLHGSWFW